VRLAVGTPLYINEPQLAHNGHQLKPMYTTEQTMNTKGRPMNINAHQWTSMSKTVRLAVGTPMQINEHRMAHIDPRSAPLGLFAECVVSISCEHFLSVCFAHCVVNPPCEHFLWVFLAPCFANISCGHALWAFVAPRFVSISGGPFHWVCLRDVLWTFLADISRGYVRAMFREHPLPTFPVGMFARCVVNISCEHFPWACLRNVLWTFHVNISCGYMLRNV
jgi:hypothetical protein